MSKKVLIVSSSLRAGSNSEILAREAEKGAREAGHEVEFISLKGKNLQFCQGCLACQKTSKCIIKDDMADMITKVQNADSIIFVTPIYYYELSGQLKTFLDRCNPLFPAEYKFRDIYLITTSADSADAASATAANGLQGWISCFARARLAGVLAGGGLEAPKEAVAAKNLLQKAYDLGNKI